MEVDWETDKMNQTLFKWFEPKFTVENTISTQCCFGRVQDSLDAKVKGKVSRNLS